MCNDDTDERKRPWEFSRLHQNLPQKDRLLVFPARSTRTLCVREDQRLWNSDRLLIHQKFLNSWKNKFSCVGRKIVIETFQFATVASSAFVSFQSIHTKYICTIIYPAPGVGVRGRKSEAWAPELTGRNWDRLVAISFPFASLFRATYHDYMKKTCSPISLRSLRACSFITTMIIVVIIFIIIMISRDEICAK